jgi:hypothetical protein
LAWNPFHGFPAASALDLLHCSSEDERVYLEGTGMLEALFFIYSMTSAFRLTFLGTELFFHFSTHSYLTNLGIPVSTI